jgi:hypothetical protein
VIQVTGRVNSWFVVPANRKRSYWVRAIIGSPGPVARMPLRSRKELFEQFF